MDDGLLSVVFVASVCIGLVLSVFGAILALGINILFSPPAYNPNLGILFGAVMLLGLVFVALSFRGKKRHR